VEMRNDVLGHNSVSWGSDGHHTGAIAKFLGVRVGNLLLRSARGFDRCERAIS
jgi:hypothetical protein